MKIIVSILFSLFSLVGFGQVFQTNQSPWRFRGLIGDSINKIPAANDTPYMANPKWGENIDGALYLKKSDSTLWAKIGPRWVLMGGQNQLDSTDFEPVIDSTGNDNYRVLFAKNGKITGESAFVYRDATNTLRLNYYLGSTNNFSIQAGDKVLIADSLLLTAIETTYDTTLNKPTTIDANGVVKKLGYWPVGSGSGSSNDNLDSVVQRGNWTTDSLNIRQGSDMLAILYGRLLGGSAYGGSMRLKNNFNSLYADFGFNSLIFNNGSVNQSIVGYSVAANGGQLTIPDSTGYFTLGVKANGTTYMAGTNGIADLGTIGGGGDTTGLGDLYIRNTTTHENKRFNVQAGRLDSILAASSAGITMYGNSGTPVALYGAGGGSGVTYYGGVNIDGTTRLATSLTGILKATSGTVSVATSGTDYITRDSLAVRKKGTNLQNIVSFNSNSNGTAGAVNADSATIAIGNLAANNMTSGIGNIGIGGSAIRLNTTGAYNVGIGFQALQANLTGSNSVAIGHLALTSFTGSENVAIGRYALENNVSGTTNTAVGGASVLRNATGSANTGMGHSAMFSLTSGSSNTAVGVNAGAEVTTGSQNSSLGSGAGRLGGTGEASNVAIGYFSDQYDSGSFTVMLGTESGNGDGGGSPTQHTGDYNIGIGYRALYNTTTVRSGASNIAIGDRIDIPAPASSNQVTIGSNGVNWLTRFTGGGWLVNYSGSAVTSQTASAALEVNGTTGGVLVPRLTTTQQNAISSPATGLIIWNSDSLDLCKYTGVSWRRVGSNAWVDYSGTSTIVGWSSFTSKLLRYSVNGKQCTVNYYIEGTSDATSITFTLPFAIGASGVTPLQGITFAINNGSAAIAQFSLAASTVTLSRFNAIGATTTWTNSGTKRAAGTFTYEID